MDKAYNFKNTEGKIYQFWEKGGWFTPIIDKTKKPFVITLPPPNVTGSLHAGHAMMVTEDILARYRRMKGDVTLFLPGFDHASIAVEYLVTKQLAKQGKNKKEVGRKEFLKIASKFADDSKQYIKSQLVRLGFSLDWTREAYTMDKPRTLAVKEAFRRLYDQGLIYKGQYIVNWCPKCQTAISDLENVYEEEAGVLYYIKYGPITIATTRPETMFADVAVAINPKNKKYKSLVGTTVPLPLTNRDIPIISDSAVDPDFGTGALKITPAHDELDYEIGKRHNLAVLSVVDRYGRLTELAGSYQGLKVAEARKKVADDLQQQGFLEKTENFTHSVGHCQRCNTIIEPMVSEQWFVKTKPLAQKAIAAVKNKEIQIVPKRFEKTYFNWLENIKDWCISRQLWWGHPIPIKGETDVLDTWFSSGLWPISTLAWPENSQDFQYFYPASVRETGYDILFFWVAREIMLCLAMTNKVPFKTIYLHGLVRDEHGKKFSKTAGIGFDPLIMMDKYGTDALRMALIAGNAPGNDTKIGEDKIKAYRNFANKVWNASRFAFANLEFKNQKSKIKNNVKNSKLHKDDEWILKETENVTKKVTDYIDRYRFDLACEQLYDFFWHTFCDKYLELAKNHRQESQKTLIKVLETSLKLLHPFMPFVTEQIWQIGRKNKSLTKLGYFNSEALIIAQWPKQDNLKKQE